MGDQSGFASLRAKRRSYVDSARENGFEEGLRRLLADLYPDNAHFVYELMQNAEDAGATTIEFELADDALHVRHDGERPFSLEDVESITSIGQSTKTDEHTKIGKFGVGFKAVFAYTDRPEIVSGDYAFAIEDLFVPVELDQSASDRWTRFTFPFNRSDKPAATAAAEVDHALRDLSAQALLFLTHIRQINYELPDGSLGLLTRTDLDELTVQLEESQGDSFVTTAWLRLTGPARSVNSASHTVSVAFQLKEREGTSGPAPTHGPKDRTHSAFQVVPVADAHVAIYFPAVKEVSGLKFHIHAPFASTVARDSVRDTDENAALIGDIASLILRTLPEIRDRGALDDGLLAALPNANDAVAPMYEQIRSAVLEAFNDTALAPVRGGRGFAPAHTLVASPAEFRKRLREEDLEPLVHMCEKEAEGPLHWIRDLGGRAGQFLDSLETVTFGWAEIDRALQRAASLSCVGPSQFESWVKALTDEDLLNLYRLLGLGASGGHLKRAHLLARLTIIRSERRGVREHHRGTDVYLPGGRSDTSKSRVMRTLAYFDDETGADVDALRAFYRAAGVRRWDRDAGVQTRLKKYATPRNAPDLTTASGRDEHLMDMQAFIEWAGSSSARVRDTFKDVPFIAAQDPNGEFFWIRPDCAFLDGPLFTETGLASLYVWEAEEEVDEEQDGEETSWFWLDEPERYAPAPAIYLNIYGLEEFFNHVGVLRTVEISEADVRRNKMFQRVWEQGTRRSAHTIERDWEIEDLASIVHGSDPVLMRTLWESVVDAPAQYARAVFRANGSAPQHLIASRLVQQLNDRPWIVDRDGERRRPQEITLDDLPRGWKVPDARSLARQLEFGADAKRRAIEEAAQPEYAEKLGITMHGVNILRQLGQLGMTADDLEELVRESARRQSFPEDESDDPERRAGIASEYASNAPEHRTETRPRSVVAGQGDRRAETRAYLREHYTDSDGQMYCQGCHQPMPFKVKGEWYFESIVFVAKRRYAHLQNYLALCPLCAALYRHTLATSPDDLMARIRESTVSSGQGRVELTVTINGGDVRLWFTGKHFIDVRAVMAAAPDARE